MMSGRYVVFDTRDIYIYILFINRSTAFAIVYTHVGILELVPPLSADIYIITSTDEYRHYRIYIRPWVITYTAIPPYRFYTPYTIYRVPRALRTQDTAPYPPRRKRNGPQRSPRPPLSPAPTAPAARGTAASDCEDGGVTVRYPRRVGRRGGGRSARPDDCVHEQ